MREPSKRVHEFGPFCLDPTEGVLLRKGERVHLTPKEFDILLTLVQNRGHLLSKDELMRLVWKNKGIVVEEGNLTQNIWLLRKALGEDPNSPIYIETVPRKGYRFIAQVRDKDLGPGLSTPPEKVIPPPGDVARRSRRSVGTRARLVLVAGALVVAISFAVFMLRPRGHVEVGNVTFSGQQLLAWKDGRTAWSYDFGQPLKADGTQAPELSQRLVIQDVNNDGRKEVLLVAPLLFTQKGDSSTDALYCFSSEGKLLWQRAFRDRLRFHGDDAGPRWGFGALMTAPDGPKTSIWFTICEPYLSTSILFRMDAQGAATPYFVNYGHLRTLHRLQTAAGSYILAGGINNDANCAMLAVLRDSAASGHSPAINTSAECDRCPPGQPFRYFLFPRTEVSRVIGPAYNEIHGMTSTDGQLQAMSAETETPPLEAPADGATYDFSPDFVPMNVTLTDNYWEDHRRLSAEGKIKHSVEECPERLKPIVVRMWTPEGGWKDVALPPIATATARR